MLCRFYSWKLGTVRKLTLPQANIYLKEIGIINRLENGEPQPVDAKHLRQAMILDPAVRVIDNRKKNGYIR